MFMAQWKRKIKLRPHDIISAEAKYAGAYAAAAALVNDGSKCIAKEAALLLEWVMRGQYSFSDAECIESNQIREHALSLMIYQGSGSIAAMVGAAKEAKLLCGWLRQEVSFDVTMCREIREEACAIMLDMRNEASAANGNSIAAADDGAEKYT